MSLPSRFGPTHRQAAGDGGPSAATARPSELTARLIEAFNSRDWAQLEGFYHAEALLRTVAGQGRALRPGALLAALRSAAADAVYQYDVSSLVDLDERVCLGSGRIRHRLLEGGFSDHQQHWLYVFEDGLLWRSGVYPTARDARTALRDEGHDLGIDPSRPPAADPAAAGPGAVIADR